MHSIDQAFINAFTCYRRVAVAVLLGNREFSLLNVFFQSNYREINSCIYIVESIKPAYAWNFFLFLVKR